MDNKSVLSETELKENIIDLTDQLDGMYTKLFLMRFLKIIKSSEEELLAGGVSNLEFHITPNEWKISYDHETDNFNGNNYNYHSDSDDEEIKDRIKISNVEFGMARKYYIKGTNIRSTRFKIYKNSKKELRIINADYDIELDLDDQYSLVKKYTNNYTIPEWVAIRFFLYMAKNDLESEDIINHFDVLPTPYTPDLNHHRLPECQTNTK